MESDTGEAPSQSGILLPVLVHEPAPPQAMLWKSAAVPTGFERRLRRMTLSAA